ncbi:MAG: response regulator [Anaerolineae bacterium]
MIEERGEKIRVLIVDDIPETRENLRKLVQFEGDIEVVGAATGGAESIEMAKELAPDIVLMDINMPDLDGIAAAEAILQASSRTQLVMMSVQGEADYLRRSMLAGAREFLTKPFTSDELVTAIRRVYRLQPRIEAPPVIQRAPPLEELSRPTKPEKRGKAIALYSPKGGVGCSTIATNLAIALGEEGETKVALVDFSLQFGDLGVLLNLRPQSTVADLAPLIDELDDILLDEVMQAHSSGVKALLAPPQPEMADLVAPEHMRKILAQLKSIYDYIIVDTESSLSDLTLAVLESSDKILLVITPDIPTIKNARLFFEVMEALDHRLEDIVLVLNKVDRRGSIQEENIETSVKHPIASRIRDDHQAALAAANQGIPLLIGQKSRPISQDILTLAHQLNGELEKAEKPMPEEAVSGSSGLIRRIFRSPRIL